MKNDLINISDGTTLKNNNQESLKVKIVPPNEVLLYRKIILVSKENHTLMEICDSLLPKLLSGNIRVPVEVR